MKTMKPGGFISSKMQMLQPIKPREPTELEQELIEKETRKRLAHIIVADRMSLNGQVFWSKNYARKGNSDSFTIFFLFQQKEAYGEILEFLEIDNSFYCFVLKFNSFENSSHILSKEDGYFYDVSYKILFNRFFKLYEISNDIILINVNNILSKCIKVKNGSFNFITKISYEFEHD